MYIYPVLNETSNKREIIPPAEILTPAFTFGKKNGSVLFHIPTVYIFRWNTKGSGVFDKARSGEIKAFKDQ